MRLELVHVWQQYKKENPVLRDVSLEIGSGESVAVIGPSGAGKTTLLRLFNRMVEPAEGQVLLDGADLDSLAGESLREAQRKIAMIFQDFCLVEESSCLQNVLNGSLARLPFWRVCTGLFPEGEQELAREALERVRLWHKAEESVARLSGGEKQRVAIARALVQQAPVLLADEPVASLDPGTAEEILELVRSLAEEKGLTVVMNSHQVAHARKYARRIVGLREGRIFKDAPAEEWTEEDFAALYRGGTS